ncbi:MAG: hypothetical protein EAZ84_06345 [Verrucomicrobia bacterium]|nr:MAG: hypothetical protein EAZ84_06345 [Verrucomicrobiota bacterium]
MKPYMKSIRSFLAGVGLIASLALPAMSQVVYFDDFNDQQNLFAGGPYTQTLGGSAPAVRSVLRRCRPRPLASNNVATPTSSNFLAFTPTSGQNYTVQMTIDTTGLGGADPGGTSSWFTVGFTSSQHHWNGSDAATIDVGHLVRWNSNAVTTITYTVAGSDLVAAGIQYVGWITDRPGVVNLNSSSQVKIDNFSLIASVPNPTLTYVGNGFDAGTVPVDPSSPYTPGAVATIAAPGDMALSGYTFMGWNTAADGSGTSYAPGSTFTIYNNTTLYAKWLANTISVVTYNGNGNTGGSAPVDSNLYDSSTSPSATVLSAGTLTKTSFTFSGWNTAADGSGTSYSENDTFAISANTTLYAIWTPGPDYVWSNGGGTDTWNTSDANWHEAVWTNSSANNAMFTSVGGNVYLSSGLIANSVNVGGAVGNFANLGFVDGTLSASSLLVQGSSTNGGNYGANPILTIDSNLSISGDVSIGRSSLNILGGSFTADRIVTNAASADWARFVVSGGTVTATNGVDGSLYTSATFAVDLNGGELQTPSLRVANREAGTNNNAWLTFNGGTLKAIGADNANFITTYGGGANTYVASGGAVIDTNGFNIGIQVSLRASGFDGGLTKNGAGTLTLSGLNNYTGNTAINAGSLILAQGGQLAFKLTEEPASTTISGTGSATFNGSFSIDTSAITGSTGYIWTLVDRVNLSSVSFDATTFAVIGFDDTDNDGVWTMSDAKGAWSFSEATGELTLDIGNDYDDWGSAYGLATGSEAGDLDNDGVSNLDEYAFGLLPNSGNSVQPIVAQLNPSTRSFSYTRRDLSKTDLIYSVWYSTDLQTWTEDVAASEGASTLNADVETVSVTLSAAAGEPLPSKLFIQVRAQ